MIAAFCKLKVYFVKFLLLFLLLCLQIEARLIPEAEPLALVQGCVNVVTGDFVLQQTDLCFGGLCHARNYDSGSSEVNSTLGKGFTWAIARGITSQNNGGSASLEEREGVSLGYRLKTANQSGLEYEVDPAVFKRGYTSYAPGCVSGAHSLHNVTLQLQNFQTRARKLGEASKEYYKTGGQWIVTLGCGTQRVYRESGLWWKLHKEIRPDGNRVFFDFDDQANLRKVWLTDSSEATALVALSLDHQAETDVVIGSNGQTVRYEKKKWRSKDRYHAGRYDFRLAKVTVNQADQAEYSYHKNLQSEEQRGNLAQVCRPDGRVLHIDYDKADRVIALKGPVGEDETLHVFARFGYQEDKREVFGPQGEIARTWL